MSDALRQVDFERQVLLAYASGWDKGATGTITVVDVTQYRDGDNPPVDVTVKVGQISKNCGDSVTVKNPFVLAIVEAPAGGNLVAGYTAISFADGCGQGK